MSRFVEVLAGRARNMRSTPQAEAWWLSGWIVHRLAHDAHLCTAEDVNATTSKYRLESKPQVRAKQYEYTNRDISDSASAK